MHQCTAKQLQKRASNNAHPRKEKQSQRRQKPAPTLTTTRDATHLRSPVKENHLFRMGFFAREKCIKNRNFTISIFCTFLTLRVCREYFCAIAVNFRREMRPGDEDNVQNGTHNDVIQREP
jgi:hypothetical protein